MVKTFKSENERYGFYGTMTLDDCADAALPPSITAASSALAAPRLMWRT